MKKLHIFLLLLIGLCITYIISTSGNYSSYADFGSASSADGKEFQIVGNLNKSKTLYYEPSKDPNYFSFYMYDKKGKEMKVVYKGAQPADFERSEDIVLTGKVQGDEFIASKILLKCPSKYNDGKLETREFESAKG
ncbi:MAG: cytochrome c maturation protein CcmE [Sphingobacteriales bacterium]|nr:cytochrome c maturation protein CcmE [Sphingobacteriales bacterium]